MTGAEILYAQSFNRQGVGSSFLILQEGRKQICYDAVTGERFPLELNGLTLSQAHVSDDGRQLHWDQKPIDGTTAALNVDSRKLTILHLQSAEESPSQALAYYTFR